jgi:heme oxygenase
MVLERLRHETREHHERIERALRLDDNLTLQRHRETLVAFLGFLEPWEDAVAASVRGDASLLRCVDERRKLPALRHDLIALGMAEAELDALPRCEELPDVSDPGRALGSMYVIEGSTLGGQVLSRHVEQTLGMRDGVGYSYYQSYGGRVGAMWKQFRELLLARSSPARDDQMVSAACETFARLEAWMCERSPAVV